MLFGNYNSIYSKNRNNILPLLKEGVIEMSVGEILKELREEKHMTQEQLGKVLGVSGRQISNYECNNQIFRDEKSFQKIFDFFGISADYLFGLSDDKTYDEIFSALNDYKKLSPDLKKEFINYLEYLMYKQKHKKPNS